MKYRGQRIPWYVWLCLVFAFLGGGFTVVACIAVFIVLVVVNALIWVIRVNQQEKR
jgi:hypothetical protein